jgi:hypothetical protein
MDRPKAEETRRYRDRGSVVSAAGHVITNLMGGVRHVRNIKKPGRQGRPGSGFGATCARRHEAELRVGIRSEYQPEGEGSESLLQDLPYLTRIIHLT